MAASACVVALRGLIVEHDLRQTDVAGLLGVSLKTVESWLATEGSAHHRNMRERHLVALRALLPAFLRARRSALKKKEK